MKYLLERLDWDSNFFGYEVAKITIMSKVNDELLFDVIHDSKGFKLVYILSNHDIFKNTQQDKFSNIYHVDTKLTFDLKITKEKPNSSTTCKEYNLVRIDEESESLKSLVFLSGKHSRYFKDKNFVQDEFKRLYLKWIESSLYSESNKKVFGYKDGERVIAFVSIKILELNVLIELIAVDESYQGKGIGKMLINELLAFCMANNIEEVKVVTQSENKSACGLYASCGMQLFSKQFLYHLWN